MKKTVFTLLLAAGTLLPLSAKTDVEVEWSFNNSQARMVSSDAHLYVRPYTVELALIDSIRYKWRVPISGDDYKSRLSFDNRGEINIEQSQRNMQTYAVYKASVGAEASENHGRIECDVILAPLFNMTFNQSGCVIEFTGYPAVYKNWKTATINEFERWIYFDRDQSDTKKTIGGNVGVQEIEVRNVQRGSETLRSLISK